MIEIVHDWKVTWSMFTLSSLLTKSEDIRLHIYVDDAQWDSCPKDWIISNFPNVKLYRKFWRTENASRNISHLKKFWENKGLNKRIMYAGGNRVFLKSAWKNEVPKPDFFQNKLAHLSRKRVYKTHPNFKRFYQVLGTFTGDRWDTVDPEFFMLNYDQLVKWSDDILFYKADSLETYRTGNETDRKVLAANDKTFFTNILENSPSWLPLYMNGKNDSLIDDEALEIIDLINHNIMMRKSFSINIQHVDLVKPYHQLCTSKLFALPWDCYTSLIDNIPQNYRDEKINETLLIKADRQKIASRKLLENGYQLGKL